MEIDKNAGLANIEAASKLSAEAMESAGQFFAMFWNLEEGQRPSAEQIQAEREKFREKLECAGAHADTAFQQLGGLE